MVGSSYNLEKITRMEDTCSPGKNTSLQSFRAYTVIFPMIILFLILEAFFIIASIPTASLGDALSIKGFLPKIPTKL
jgi:hypothetical protein